MDNITFMRSKFTDKEIKINDKLIQNNKLYLLFNKQKNIKNKNFVSCY